MKSFCRITLLTTLLALLFVPAASAQTCTPGGTTCFWYGCFYDHISNGGPSGTSCWSVTNASVVTNSVCGFSSTAFEFAYAGEVSQQFTIPSTMTGSNFDLGYLYDVDDPNNDGAWNQLYVEVKDMTTNTILGWKFYSGAGTDVYCGRDDITFTRTGLAGHTLQVRVQGSKAYSDTHIRIRKIFFYQN
jgi:hypothetical protein